MAPTIPPQAATVAAPPPGTAASRPAPEAQPATRSVSAIRRGTPSMHAAVNVSGDPMLGRVVDGRYRVLDMLGSGGMGTVYRVMHERMHKVMALKVLNPRLSADPVVRARFKREARAASLLESRNTVAVFDFGETPDGQLYLAMEYLRGRTLAQLLRERGTLPPARIARILSQVLKSLEEAHAQGIVHRDIKPDNIFLLDGEDPEAVKVLDFGIAKGERIQDKTASGPTTRSDLVVGTPEYMAPEQARGQVVDGRSDLWAVAAILHEALVGRLPFGGPTAMDVLVAVMEKSVPTPPDGTVPPPMWRLVETGLKKNPAQRFQNAAAMREAFAVALGELGNPAVSTTPTPMQDRLDDLSGDDGLAAAGRGEWEEFARVERRRRLLVGGVLGGVAALGLAVLVPNLMPQGPATAEHEPNNAAAMATPIAAGTTLAGTLAVPENGKPDVDMFVLNLPKGPQVLSANVQPTGPVPVNLGLTVWVDGKKVFDGYGRSMPHPRAPNVTVEGRQVFVRVAEENATTDTPPSPAAVDYALSIAALRPLGAGEEREPNNLREEAMLLGRSSPVAAWMSPGDDEDLFKLNLPDPAETVDVDLSPGAELALDVEAQTMDGRRVAQKQGRAGERVVMKVDARRCGSPCVVRVAARGKAPPGDPGYRITVN